MHQAGLPLTTTLGRQAMPRSKEGTMIRSKVVLVMALLLPVEALSQDQSAGIAGVVAAGAMVELVKEGFQFTEGPVGTPDGGLYFTDVRASSMYRLHPSGGINVFRDNTAEANGLAFDRAGNLLAVEAEGKRIIRIDSRGAVAVIAAQAAAGQAFLRPNDLIVDRRGGIYVTDPGPIGRKGKAFVYYVRPEGQVLLVSDDIRFPNGLTLTRDEKVLLVADSRGNIIFAFDIQNDGNAINKRPFAHLQGIPEGKLSFADGMALDSVDRLYVTTFTGIQVFDAGGTYLGTIRVPRQPTNLAFSGPDKRTLYITAREGLYRLIMLSRGPDRPGK
jgi:gluconolactonase